MLSRHSKTAHNSYLAIDHSYGEGTMGQMDIGQVTIGKKVTGNAVVAQSGGHG